MEHPENSTEYAGLQVNAGVEQQSIINPYLKRGRFKRREYTVDEMVDGILAGNITMLSQAVTLIESVSPEHQAKAQEIIERCLPYSGNSVRIGISGVPGAGKSTLIRTINKMIDITEGQLTVNGVDIPSLKGKALRKFRRKIGMVLLRPATASNTTTVIRI